MKYFILFLFTLTTAEAFTLNNNFAASFKKSKVKVAVAGDSICTGITAQEMESLIAPSVNDFWNEVPTSRLRLKSAGFTVPIATVDINTARLCSPTDSACIASAATNGENVLPPVDGIVIACNSNANNFTGNSVLAVTVPNNFASKKIKGAVILINDNANIAGEGLRALTHSDRIGVIAHEIGHAIGLGHADESEEQALMYYRVVDQRRSLGQDDIDGVTYLYPIKIDGCGLFDGLVASTVAMNKKDDSDDDQNGGGTPFWQMGIGFSLLIIFAEILKRLKRLQTRPAF
ncbi:MAG: matrixin family metalloprotease [Bdellovibrionota bacterium]